MRNPAKFIETAQPGTSRRNQSMLEGATSKRRRDPPRFDRQK